MVFSDHSFFLRKKCPPRSATVMKDNYNENTYLMCNLIPKRTKLLIIDYSPITASKVAVILRNNRARQQIIPNNNYKYYILIILIVTHSIPFLMSFKCEVYHIMLNINQCAKCTITYQYKS